MLGSPDAPRLFWLEEEYRAGQRRAELDYIRRLADDIERGTLDGIDWWHAIHADVDAPLAPPPAAAPKT